MIYSHTLSFAEVELDVGPSFIRFSSEKGFCKWVPLLFSWLCSATGSVLRNKHLFTCSWISPCSNWRLQTGQAMESERFKSSSAPFSEDAIILKYILTCWQKSTLTPKNFYLTFWRDFIYFVDQLKMTQKVEKKQRYTKICLLYFSQLIYSVIIIKKYKAFVFSWMDVLNKPDWSLEIVLFIRFRVYLSLSIRVTTMFSLRGTNIL